MLKKILVVVFVLFGTIATNAQEFTSLKVLRFVAADAVQKGTIDPTIGASKTDTTETFYFNGSGTTTPDTLLEYGIYTRADSQEVRVDVYFGLDGIFKSTAAFSDTLRKVATSGVSKSYTAAPTDSNFVGKKLNFYRPAGSNCTRMIVKTPSTGNAVTGNTGANAKTGILVPYTYRIGIVARPKMQGVRDRKSLVMKPKRGGK